MVRRAKNPLERSRAGDAQLRLPPGIPHPIDIHVGARLRTRRTLCAFTQEALARAVGLTFQQIQKYERGSNRIGSSRLFQFSKVLDVPISFFFDDMPEAGEASATGMAEPGATYSDASLTRRETLELVRAYYKITDPATRKRIFELVKAIGRVDAGA